MLTRREFLELGLFASIAPGALAHRFAASPAPWRFAVFSDTHFGIPGHLEKNRALLREIGTFAPELALISGDVTERGWGFEYDDAETAFGDVPFPIHAAPGNHDVRWAPLGLLIFEERMGPPRQVFTHRGCGFVLLDSTVPLSHWGHIGGPQRRWLAAALERLGRDLPLFVFLHHPTGRQPAAVDDQDALAEVLAPYNVKVVFTAHGHSDLDWEWRALTHTMGRGLYQGSYQLAEVDPTAGVVRLLRRTAEAPVAVPFATLPLARSSRPTPSAAEPAITHHPARQQEREALRPAWRLPLGGGVMSHLLLRDGTLYVSAMDGSVSAVAAADGRLLWKAMTNGYCHSSPVVAGDALVVGSADGGIYCFGLARGEPRWRVATGGPVYASAAVTHGIAVIASGDGTVYGIDLDSGHTRWRSPLPPGPSAFSQSPAATDGERVYLGAWDNHVHALDVRTGQLAWRYLADPRAFYYSPAIAAPALADGRLYVASNGNTLHAIDAATGEAIWRSSSPGDKFGYSSPKLVDGRLYIGCLGELGEVRCLAADDARELWVSATGSTIYESSPALAAGRLAIGSVDGTLWLLSADDGARLASWSFPPGHFLSSPAAAPGRVYAATFAEDLVAFEVVAND